MSVFYQIGTDDDDGDGSSLEGFHLDQNEVAARKAQEHEFRIGCVGVSGLRAGLLSSLEDLPFTTDYSLATRLEFYWPLSYRFRFN